MCLFLICIECHESFENETSRAASRLATVDGEGALASDIILSQCDACRDARRSPFYGDGDGDGDGDGRDDRDAA